MKPSDYRAKRRQDPAYVQVEAQLSPILELADEVLRLRLQHGWTQADLAKRVGTRQANISRLESGLSNPTLDFLLRVSSALGSELVVRPVLPGETRVRTSTAVALRSDTPLRAAEGTESV